MSKMKKLFDNDNYQDGLRAVIICTLAVILVVGINLLCALIPTGVGNVDVSTERVHSISKDTEDLLSKTDRDITCYYVCEPGEEYHNTEVMLNLYADGSDKISVEKVDPAFDLNLISKYVKDGEITNNSVIMVSGEKSQVINYSDYYTSGTFVLEDYMNSAIEYVSGDETKRAYTLTGHSEVEIHSSTVAYMGLDGYKVEPLNLMESKDVPQNANLVIINGIKNDISADEAQGLLRYVKAGGSILVVTDYTTSTMNNLNEVASYFGASISEGLIMEADKSRFFNDNPAYILPNIKQGDFTITKGINYVLLPNCMPIIIDENADKDVKATTLLETTADSVSMINNIFTNEVNTAEGPFSVAASFQRGDDETGGKMIIVTSKYVSDVSVSNTVGGGNVTFFLNSVRWLGEREAVESIHAKGISTQYLDITLQQQQIWRIVLIFVIPIVVVLIGVLVILRRKKRR